MIKLFEAELQIGTWVILNVRKHKVDEFNPTYHLYRFAVPGFITSINYKEKKIWVEWVHPDRDSTNNVYNYEDIVPIVDFSDFCHQHGRHLTKLENKKQKYFLEKEPKSKTKPEIKVKGIFNLT